MPFKYLMDVLRCRETRLDRIERRLGRIESNLCTCSSQHTSQRIRAHDGDRSSRPTRRPSTRTVRRARTVHGPDGWYIRERPGEVRSKGFNNNWLIEFDCPRCGRASRKGVNHLWTEFEDDHVNYQVRLTCRYCGWKEDKVNIRGYK